MSLYSILLITHRLVVTVFLVQYVLKLWYLLLGRNEQLDTYSKVTRVPEMIVSVLFLVTGIWMIVAGAVMDTFMIIKLVCVLAAIPTAIIGFRKHNKMLGVLAILLILAAYGLAEVHKKHKGDIKADTTSAPASSEPLVVGKSVYSSSCVNCHGADGKLGGSGAKDLTMTQLTVEQQKQLIRNGKSAMPAYPAENLSDEQLSDVVLYVASLKK